MNITFEKTDEVSGLLTMNIEKADYAGNVEKALKDIRKKANMPGFRPGQMPMAIVKKRFGAEATVEAVNRLVAEKMQEYIRDNKIAVLGEPLPNEKQESVDFEKQDQFSVYFDVAVAPEFEIALSKDDKIDYYTIDVNDELVQRQVDMYAQRAGSYDKVDEYQEKDMVKGLIAQLDENGSTLEGGIQVEGAVMLPDYMKNEDEKAKFTGCKVNDVLVFNPYKAYEGSDIELSSLLKISKEEAAEMKSDFSYQVTEITRFTPAAVDQKFFDQVLGEGEASSEEEFRGKLKEQMQEQFRSDSDYKFIIDARKYVEEKVGELKFSDGILKRFFKLQMHDKDEAFINEHYEGSIDMLKWQLIKEKLCAAYEIKVNDDDVLNTAKEATRMQLAQYGMANVPDEMLDNYAKEMLKKNENLDKLIGRCVEDKIGKAIQAAVTLEHKTVSIEDFNKMFA